MPRQVVRLRPHHCLCIRFFRGHGYSEAFTANMRRVIARLDGGGAVELVDGMDDVCACCPNNSAGTCSAEAKVRRYDAGTMAALGEHGFAPGVPEDWRAVCAAVSAYIMEGMCAGSGGGSRRFDAICGDCQWSSLCH